MQVRKCYFPSNQFYFFGGGTPSILNPHQIKLILDTIHKHFDLSQIKEFNYECHLTTVTEDRLQVLKEAFLLEGFARD